MVTSHGWLLLIAIAFRARSQRKIFPLSSREDRLDRFRVIVAQPVEHGIELLHQRLRQYQSFDRIRFSQRFRCPFGCAVFRTTRKRPLPR